MSSHATVTNVLGIECERGAKASGFAFIGELRTGTRVELPVRIVSGSSEGPQVVLTGVIHGDEPNGLVAINRVCDELDPGTLRGTVVGFPVCNPFAFITNSRISGLDYERLNLNRVFPGNTAGLIGERMAAAVFEVVRGADALIDFHEGGYDFIARYLIAPDPSDDPRIAAANLRLARAFGMGVPINVVRLTQQHINVGRLGTITTQANMAGIPGICNELGGAGTVWPEHVATAVSGTLNVLKELEMYPGPKEEAAQPQLVGTDSIWPRPGRGGWWEQSVALGQVVEENAILGHVRNLLGEVIEEVRAPFRSVIFDVRNTAAIMTGEWTVHCGRLIDGAAAEGRSG